MRLKYFKICFSLIVSSGQDYSGPETVTESGMTEIDEPEPDWIIEPSRTPSEKFGQCRLPVVPSRDPDVSAASGKLLFFKSQKTQVLNYLYKANF